MRRDYSDNELRALILDWLERHGRWGAHYYPVDRIVNNLSHVVRNDGKRIRKTMNLMAREGHVFFHKKGDTLSLNPAKNNEIIEYIRKYLLKW